MLDERRRRELVSIRIRRPSRVPKKEKYYLYSNIWNVLLL